MKIKRTYRNGYLDVAAENAAENRYEKGDFITVSDRDYLVFDYEVKEGMNVYAVKPVY